MTQYITGTDTICSYANFLEESINHRRTERAQRREIDEGIAKLTEQGDFWALDLIRKATTTLVEAKGYEFYLLLREVIEAKPGEWIIRRKEA